MFCTAESLDEKQLWRAGTVPPLCMGVSVGAKDSLSLLLIFSFLTNSVSQLYHGRWLKGGFEDPHAPQCPWIRTLIWGLNLDCLVVKEPRAPALQGIAGAP